MTYLINIHRLTPTEKGYAQDRSPLLEMTTEFPDLAAVNLRLVADRLDREELAVSTQNTDTDE